MTPLFGSLSPASDPFGAVNAKGRSPVPLPPARSEPDPLAHVLRRAERSFDEQLDVTLARDRRHASRRSADPTSLEAPAPAPAERHVPHDPPPAASALDPTTAGTARSEDAAESQPGDPALASTSAAKTATGQGDRIESPRPPETEATDESVWKFAVDPAPADDTAGEAPASESSEASGPKSPPKPAARAALPDVHPTEKLVDGEVETQPAEGADPPASDLERTILPGGVLDPDLGKAVPPSSGRSDPASTLAEASAAARFQRAYEGNGTGDPTGEEHRQPSHDPSVMASTSDDSGGADVSGATSQPAAAGHDARAAIITTLAPAVAGSIDPVLETSDPRALNRAETPASDTADRLVQSLRMQFLRGGGDAVVHIRPEHLGPLTVSVRVEHGSVTAHVIADNAVVAEWLRANEQLLRESLKANGLILERLVIEKDPEQSGNGRRDPDQARRHPRRPELERQSTFDVTV